MASPQLPTSQLPVDPASSSSERSSLVLARIPLEIRQQIYKDVIASFGWGKELHILSRDPEPIDRTGKRKAKPTKEEKTELKKAKLAKAKLTYIPCTLPQSSQSPPSDQPDTYYPDWPTQHMVCQGWKATSQAPPPLRGTYLSMFLSCRKVHDEAIGLLYSEHSFAITSLRTMHRFFATVPQKQLNLIRSLHVTMIIPSFHLHGQVIPSQLPTRDQIKLQEEEIEWLRSCVALAKMRELNSLEMDFWNSTHNEVIEEELLKGLSPVKVSNGGTFIVRLPWKEENPVPMVEKMSRVGITLERRQSGLEPTIDEADIHDEPIEWWIWGCMLVCCPCILAYYLGSGIGSMTRKCVRSMWLRSS